jgi:hypothetical protein
MWFDAAKDLAGSPITMKPGSAEVIVRGSVSVSRSREPAGSLLTCDRRRSPNRGVQVEQEPANALGALLEGERRWGSQAFSNAAGKPVVRRICRWRQVAMPLTLVRCRSGHMRPPLPHIENLPASATSLRGPIGCTVGPPGSARGSTPTTGLHMEEAESPVDERHRGHGRLVALPSPDTQCEAPVDQCQRRPHTPPRGAVGRSSCS